MPAPPIARLLRHRVGALVAALLVAAMGTVFWPAAPATAAPPLQDQCSTQRWQDPGQWQECLDKIKPLAADRASTYCCKSIERRDCFSPSTRRRCRMWMRTECSVVASSAPGVNVRRYSSRRAPSVEISGASSFTWSVRPSDRTKMATSAPGGRSS